MKSDAHLRRRDGLLLEAFRRRLAALRGPVDDVLLLHEQKVRVVRERLRHYAAHDRDGAMPRQTARPRRRGLPGRALLLRRARARGRSALVAGRASLEVIMRARASAAQNQERIMRTMNTLRDAMRLLGRAE